MARTRSRRTTPATEPDPDFNSRPPLLKGCPDSTAAVPTRSNPTPRLPCGLIASFRWRSYPVRRLPGVAGIDSCPRGIGPPLERESGLNRAGFDLRTWPEMTCPTKALGLLRRSHHVSAFKHFFPPANASSRRSDRRGWKEQASPSPIGSRVQLSATPTTGTAGTSLAVGRLW